MSRNNSRGAMGALHPVLFFVFVYGISLFLAFFICSAVYNSLHPAAGTSAAEAGLSLREGVSAGTSAAATAMR